MKRMLEAGVWMWITLATSQMAAAMPQSGASGALVVTTKVDRNTGLTVKQMASPSGSLSVDVRNSLVAIHKELQPGKSTLTLTANRQVVTLRFTEGKLVVSGVGGERRLDQLNDKDLAVERGRLAASPVVQSARALLAQMDLSPDSLAGAQLSLSRLALTAICGDDIAFKQTGAKLASQLSKPRPVTIAWQDLQGPFKCWDEYSDFVMQAWQDFWQCIVDHVDSWIPEFWSGLCEFKWLLQAELSGSWLIACMGGLPVR